MVATTTAEKRDRAIFLGGLGGVRGLADSRYFGKHVWLANAELRIPSLDMRWLALQHVIFLDAAGIDKRPSQFWSLRAASSGLGLRVISPKIHGMVARIDYAFSMVGDGPYALSFGAGQYF
jgi:hemolysin activation/secretion protein